jgi:phosphoribosylaminoimidazolecarboxamide formyltransferase / IMP cyclohydrolase
LHCDPVSAFGGIIALNRKTGQSDGARDHRLFTEVIVAPDADEEAMNAIISGKKNLRLLLTGDQPLTGSGLSVRTVGRRPAGADARHHVR